MMEYRSKRQIEKQILEELEKNDGICTVTQIFYGAKLSYYQTKRYIAKLFELKMVEIAGTTVRLAPKGRRYLSSLIESEKIRES